MTATAPASIANTYLSIEDLKSRMGIAGTSNDSTLWSVLYAASRAVDRYCNRHFYAVDAVRLFDVDDPCEVSLPDLVSVTEVTEDRDGDRVFEITRSANEYFLYPLNVVSGSVEGRPHTTIRSDLGSDVEPFSVGRSRLSIEGSWGFCSYSVDSGSQISSGGGVSEGVSVIPVDAVNEIAPGMTIQIEDEQVFVRAVSGTNLTVTRGVNGTTAATHADATEISTVVFPAAVVEATAILAARYWKSKDAASAGIAGAHGYGPIRVNAGIDVEVEQLLTSYRKLPIGVGV